MALGEIAGATIGGFRPPENSKESRACATYFDQTRDFVQAIYPWNCCTEYIQLTAEDAVTPDWGWANSYQLPVKPKVLRVLALSDSAIVWRVSGTRLLTDTTDPQIVCIQSVTDPAKWSPLLTEVQVAALAMRMAFPITKNRGVANDMRTRFLDVLDTAQGTDTQEGYPDELIVDVLDVVRGGGDSTPLIGSNLSYNDFIGSE